MVLTASSFLYCSGGQEGQREVLARINDFELTRAEFERQLARELELDADFRLTKEAKKTFLEEVIRKELLIQEAKKRGLDRKEKFIRSMERYWEATLIRDLMELKGAELGDRIYVSAEEVQDYYRSLAKSEKTLPPPRLIERSSSRTSRKRRRALGWRNG